MDIAVNTPRDGSSPYLPTEMNEQQFTVSLENEINKNVSDIPDGCRLLKFLPWNNPDNIISSQTQMFFFRMLGGVLIPCVSVFGIPVNILNCMVFYKQSLRERINFLLFCLACSDFVLCVYMFIFILEYCYTQIQGNLQINGPLVTFVINYGSFVYGSAYVSGFVSTLISFERCICITYPFVAKRLLKTEIMAMIVVVMSIIIIAFIYFVSGQKFRIVCGYYPVLKLKLAAHYPNDLYQQNKRLMDVLNGLVYGICLPGLFCVTTTITTIITAVKLRGAAAWRLNTSSAPMGSKEIALTKMLVVVSCLFIICIIPNVVLRIAPVVVTDLKVGGRNQNMLLSGILVVCFASAVNSAFNFVFYYKMGSRFRIVLKGLCIKAAKSSED